MTKYLFLIILIGLLCGAAYAEAPYPAPMLKAIVQPSDVVAGDKFEYVVEISWEGDSNLFIASPPKMDLPDGLEPGGLQNSVRVENLRTIKTYTYEIVTNKAGDFTIAPVEFALRNNSTGEELKLKTDVVKVAIKESGNAFLRRLKKPGDLSYRQILGFVLIFFGALIGITALVMALKKKKTV